MGVFKIPQGAKLEVTTQGRKTYKGTFAGTARQNSQQDTADNILLIKPSSRKSDLLRIAARDIKVIRTTVKRMRTFVPLSQMSRVEKGERLEIYKHGKTKPVKGNFQGLQFFKKGARVKTGSVVADSVQYILLNKNKYIPLIEIDSVIIPVKKTNVASTYFIAGLTADVIVTVAVVSAALNATYVDLSGFASSGGSCPYV